jgi:hypothetical protein
MGSTADKAKGLANEAAGNIKQAAGKLVGNKKLYPSHLKSWCLKYFEVIG